MLESLQLGFGTPQLSPLLELSCWQRRPSASDTSHYPMQLVVTPSTRKSPCSQCLILPATATYILRRIIVCRALTLVDLATQHGSLGSESQMQRVRHPSCSPFHAQAGRASPLLDSLGRITKTREIQTEVGSPAPETTLKPNYNSGDFRDVVGSHKIPKPPSNKH